MVQGLAQQGDRSLNTVATTSSRGNSTASWAQALLLILAGCAAAAAVSWPFPFWLAQGQPQWWLQILALFPLVRVAWHSPTFRSALGAGSLYATAWLCATFWWLFIAMHTNGGLPAPLSVLAVLALASALALYYGLAVGLFWCLRGAQSALLAAAFAACWSIAEMARGTWLTGFGWGAMGYAHTDGPLALWIPLLGAYGVGALAAWCTATLALFPRTGWLQRLALAALLLAGCLPQAWQFTEPNGKLSVALLQGNIAQDEKFDSGTGVPMALNWYGAQMRSGRAELVLAPETAIPLLPQELPALYWDKLNQQFAQGNSALLTGIPLGDYVQGYTNSVIALGPDLGSLWHYDKHHLVPFGEFIPPWFKWFTRLMHIPLGDFNRGAIGQASFAWKGQRIAPNICYEDLFGEELGARFIDPELAPTVFANVSNLGWFGDSSAIDQHLQISRMRALEFQRPFLRATNTGATVSLNHQGQVLASLPRLTQGVLETTVEGRTGITPFAWWVARFGLWPLWLLALAVVAWAWYAHAARRSAELLRPAP